MTSPKTRRSSLLLLALSICFCALHPPTPARAQQGETLLLVWAANQEEDLRGYRIYESDVSGSLGTLLQAILVEDIPWEDSSRGVVSFELPDVPPGNHCWAVTAFDYNLNESLPSAPGCITLGTDEQTPIHMTDFHEDGFYGSYPGAAENYEDSVVYTFDGKPGDLLLACRLWDVNLPKEVEILVNGHSLGWAGVTGKYTCSTLVTIRIPPAYLNETGLNEISFTWSAAGPADMWAVGMVEIVELIPLPALDYYGNLANVPSGDTSHPRMVGFTFEGRPGIAFIYYEVYDVDFEGEVHIFVNGERVGRVSAVGNDAYLNAPPLFLPDDLVLDRGLNTIVFENVLNPPHPVVWGVGDVRLPY